MILMACREDVRQIVILSREIGFDYDRNTQKIFKVYLKN